MGYTIVFGIEKGPSVLQILVGFRSCMSCFHASQKVELPYAADLHWGGELQQELLENPGASENF